MESETSPRPSNSTPDARRRKFPDRVLGSSWLSWDGDVEGHEGTLNERARLYFALLGLLLLLISLVLGLDAYVLIWVVLNGRPAAALLLGALIGLPLLSWWASFFCCVACVYFGARVCAFSWLSRWLTLQMPFLAYCAQQIGVSSDRVSSSAIAVSNAVARLRLEPGVAQRPMILLPRCLRRDVVEDVRKLASRWGCPVAVAGTNAVARRRVKEHDPTTLIAVACERDLVAGLYDYGHRLPILVVPNQRIKGPCLDATIDMERLEAALIDVFGKLEEIEREGEAAG